MKRSAWLSYSKVASLVLLSALHLSGCSKRYDNLPAFSALPIVDAYNNSVGRFKTSYLADQIHAYFRGNASGPIAIATFVDLDNLYTTSSFGRMLSEQLMGELTMKGYNVIELRKADALQVMAHEGEFGLSRELARIRQNQDISAIIVGTYTVSPIRVYLNARLIDPSSSLIMSAGSVEMAKTEEIARMLRNNIFPASLERIPVRSMGYYAYPLPYYWPYPGYGRRNMFDYEEEGSVHEPRFETNDLPKPPPQPKLAPTL